MVSKEVSRMTASCSFRRQIVSRTSRRLHFISLLCITMVCNMIVNAYSSTSGQMKMAANRAYIRQRRVRLPFSATMVDRSCVNNQRCRFARDMRPAISTFVSPLGKFRPDYTNRQVLDRRLSTSIFMSASDDDNEGATATTTSTPDDDNANKQTLETLWNIPGLKKETGRLTVRCHKKIGKASQRLRKAQEEVERLTSSPDVTMEELERCPNLDELEADLSNLQQRLKQLNQLEVLLLDVKGGKKPVVLPEHVAVLAIELEVSDQGPVRKERPPKKNKGPKNMQAFRLPYRRFYTVNKTEIRVGKQAVDNDELSLSPEHRDSADWWMHASGCPGSHVVIRSHDSQLDSEVEQDAAALAARQSKCTGNVIKVSLTRARDVKKPPGAKAGLVQLTGSVKTVSVNMKKAQERLDRLDKTVLIN